jgi:kinesin family protein 20
MQLNPSSHPSLPDDAAPCPTRTSCAPFGTVYKFTSVFAPSETTPETSQADFFKDTTLPLVHDFLGGENCLLFAYGTTGSGKTWTVQGQEGEKAGLLPRVMDVVWRSLEGKESKSNVSLFLADSSWLRS